MTPTPAPPSRWPSLAWIIGLALMLTLTYLPLLVWLGKMSWQITQLSTGAVLVIFTMIICLRDSIRTLRFHPTIHTLGIVLVGLGLVFLWLSRVINFPPLPLLLLSFCFSLAGIVSFGFGKLGIRQFMPALGGFLVFGLLVGMFPALDWPLRAVAAKYAAALMTTLGLPIELRLILDGPPVLVLSLQGHNYIVATECNGFGLLTSALLLATILGFEYRLAVLKKVGMLLLAVPIAIGCNFLRIVSICYFAPRVPLSYHAVHEILGNLFYFAGLALVWQAARWAAAPPRPATAPLTDQRTTT